MIAADGWTLCKRANMTNSFETNECTPAAPSCRYAFPDPKFMRKRSDAASIAASLDRDAGAREHVLDPAGEREEGAA